MDMNYKYMVLLTSNLIYDEGSEKQASVYCDIYYPVAGEAKKLGTITSDGTAYPITFSKDAIFVASGHGTEKYAITEDGILYLEKGVYEQFDEAGNAKYTAVIRGKESELTEQEYQREDEYDRSQIVHFSYGAEDSVNEYLEAKKVLDGNNPTMVIEDLHREMERVVSSIGLENAYPWNNTVELESDADVLIKMASDDTGHMELISLEETAEESITETTMVDTSKVSGIVVTNGNTLQSVTPYKDGVVVDAIFYKYDNTGKNPVPSLNLMEYLEYICVNS